jgi:hypothetical protein
MFLDWPLKHWTDLEKAGMDCIIFLIETDQGDLKAILDVLVFGLN